MGAYYAAVNNSKIVEYEYEQTVEIICTYRRNAHTEVDARIHDFRYMLREPFCIDRYGEQPGVKE